MMVLSLEQWRSLDGAPVMPDLDFWNASVDEYVAALISTCDRYVRSNVAFLGNLEKTAYRFNLIWPQVSFRLSVDVRRDWLLVFRGLRLWGNLAALPSLAGGSRVSCTAQSPILGYWAGFAIPLGRPLQGYVVDDAMRGRVGWVLLDGAGLVVDWCNPSFSERHHSSLVFPGDAQYLLFFAPSPVEFGYALQ